MGSSSPTTPPSAEREEAIATELFEIIGESLLDFDDGADLGSNLFDQGLDSMGIMHLILVIEEKFGVQLSPSDVTKEQFGSALKIAAVVGAREAAK